MAAPDLADALVALNTQPTITVPVLAVILGVPSATVYAAVRRGQIPAIHVGRKVLIPTAKVAAMLGTGGDGC